MTRAATAMVRVFTGSSWNAGKISDQWTPTRVTCSTLLGPHVTPCSSVRDRPGTMGP